MTTALWIRDINHYQKNVNRYPELMAQSTILTTDPAACWFWQEQSMPHRSLWQFATLQDQLQVTQEALDLSDTWLHGVQALRYRDSQLDELCQTALLYTFRDALLAQRMAFRFFDHTPLTRLVLPTPDKTTNEGAQVAEAVLDWTAIQRRIPVENLAISTSTTFPFGRHFSGRVCRYLRGLIAAKFLLLQRASRHHIGQPTVMFFAAGTDFVNQLHVIEQLHRTRPYRLVHVNMSPKPPQTSAYSRSQTLKHHSSIRLSAYRDLSQHLELRAWSQRAWQWFQDWKPAYKDHYPELFCNPRLNNVFRAFFLTTLPRVGGAMEAAGQLLDTHAPALVMLNNDASGRERAIVHAARKRGIPSVLMIHSGFNDLHFRRFCADQIWVWGDMHRQQLTALGMPADRILVTGNPNYDYLMDFKRTLQSIRIKVRQQLGIAEDKVLLLLISAKSPYLLTFVDMAQHVQDLRALCQALNAHPGVQLVIKPHPRYDDVAIYHLMSKRYKWVKVVNDILLDRLLAACDAALMVNTVSTGGIEALLLGKPVIWINSSVEHPPLFSIFDAGALVISQRDQIAPALQRFLSSADYRLTIGDMGQKHLTNLVHQSAKSATEAVISKIDQIVNYNAEKYD